MRVTFNTNSVMDLAAPRATQRPELQHAAAQVRAALKAGRLQGFFSETLVTLEGVQRQHRREVFGGTRIVSRHAVPAPNRMEVSIGVVQDRKPLDPTFSRMLQAATALGLHALRAPARIGWIRVSDPDGTFFAPDGQITELLARMDKVNAMATEIARRGLGHAKAVALGRELVECDDPDHPTLWFTGLLGATDKQATRSIAEWADGDSIASHYGYGNDLFCSEDFGRNASAHSILSTESRAWLTEAFGIRFATLATLAD